jgi:hypothetical protein
MRYRGFTARLADLDVLMQPGKQLDGNNCWEYVLLYVDDALSIGVNAEKILQEEIGR